MLFRKRIAGVRCLQKMNPIIFLPLVIAIVIAITSCTATKGSIVILENKNGKEFTMDLKEWRGENKGQLFLNRDDVLQIGVTRESGVINLTVSGKKGSEPYTGNDLQSGIFTVTMSETDEYVIKITGDSANGSLAIKNLGNLK